MPKFSIAFIAPAEPPQIKHRIIESSDQDSALKTFFEEEISDFYTNDAQGLFYFKQDFSDEDNPSGNIIQIN